MGALSWLLLCFFACQAFAQCNLRLRLSDTKCDGWNGNELTVLVAGSKPTFTVVSGFAKVLSSGAVTLAGGDSGALQFSAAAGAAITFSFASDAKNWPKENSWAVELFDAYAPFGAVVLTKSSLNSDGVPVAPNIGAVACGPRPVLTDFSVESIPGPFVHNVKFDWPSLAASDNDQTVTYTVSYRNLADSNPNNWIILVGGTTQSELDAILPPASSLQLQLVATNQYGPSSAFIWTYNVPYYPSTPIYVKLYDSLSNGWGAYDGFLFLALDGVTIGSATFPCATGAGCPSLLLTFQIPNGDSFSLTSVFQPPSQNAKDCSYRILKTPADASTLFYSGQGPKGPLTPNAQITISFPGTPVKVTGPAKPTLECPTSEPKVGDSCDGVTAAPCKYDETCCCPKEKAAADRFCVSDTYVCSGAKGKWQAVLSTSPCKSDPLFRCLSDCPAVKPEVGKSCTVASTCNYRVTCNKASNCTQTDTFTCGGSVSLAWSKSTSCTCKKLPQCAPWQNLVSDGDCCTKSPSCVDDPTSTVCLNPTSWSTCTGKCGAGKQTRTTYKRVGKKCVSAVEKQSCPLPCPVKCVGSFGAFSACSVSCGTGTQTRTYKITTPAAYDGTACPFPDGYVETKTCEGSSKKCGPQCTLELSVYDSMKDGWTGGAQVTVSYPLISKPIVLSVPAGKSINTYRFTAPRGAPLTINYDCGSDPRAAEHSYEITYVVPPSSYPTSLLQSPPNLKLHLKPEANKTVLVQCVLCTAPNLEATCENLKRGPCHVWRAADNICGACQPGYTGAASGLDACKDVDECAAAENPCGIHTCTNTAGGYFCTCKTGYTADEDGNCVASGYSLLEAGQTLPASCPAYKVRVEFNDLTPALKDKFIRAVKALGAPFWTNLGNIHNTAAQDPSNVHNSGSFLAWHRGFLNDVENKFYALPGDLACTTLPYWDWTRVAVDPNPSSYLATKIFTSAKSGTLWLGIGALSSQNWATQTAHPMYPLSGTRASSASSLNWSSYSPTKVYSLIKSASYYDLWYNLNYGAHGALHNWVGGTMRTMASAADPCFFLHHGFIDLMWASYQACNGLTNPSAPNAPKGWEPGLPFTTKMPMSLAKAYTPQEVYNLESLKVRYAKAFIDRVAAASATYCPNRGGTWFTLLEVEDAETTAPVGSYPVELSVVSNTSDTDVEKVSTTVVVPAEGEKPAEGETADEPVKTTTKTKLRKKRKGPKKGGDAQMDENKELTDNLLVAHETYKSVFDKTGDDDEATSAAIDEECSQNKNKITDGCIYDDEWLEQNPYLRRACAQGLCYHECYLRSGGPNADKLKSEYQKEKEKGGETRRKVRGSHKSVTNGSAPVQKRKRRGVEGSGTYSAKALIESLALRALNGSIEL